MAQNEMVFIYLDQNIIQYDYENVLKLEPTDNFCFVYSEEHFNEINRSEDERFFEVLRRIKARKLKVKLDSNFKIIDEAIILGYQDPKRLYDEYQNTIADSKEYSNIFIPLQPYLMGNTGALDPHAINQTFVTQLKDLMKSMRIIQLPENVVENYEAMLTNIGDDLEKTLADAKDKILPIEQMRRKINKNNLSELKIEDGIIIDQIWNLVNDKFPGIEKDQLFGKKPLPFIEKKEMPIFLTVVQCHNILNTLGYWPDKGLTKTSKVYGINSDASHIAHSLFCSGIISADDRLCKKAKAIFQYLGLNKSVFQIVFENKGKKLC